LTLNSLLQLSPAVTERFPAYHGLVLVVSGLTNGPSDARTRSLLRAAEEQARQRFATLPPAEHPHLAAWRDAYRAFGVKPQRMTNSAEALISRVVKGGELPAINRLADAYNAVSVQFVVPCGGEDLDHVRGPVTLKFADGAPFVEHAQVGEVVWADAAGVTCRAWNWRQGTRTRLTEETTRAYFLFDALSPMTPGELEQAGDALEGLLTELSPGCQVERVWLGAAESGRQAAVR